MREQGSLLGFLSDPRLAPYTLGDAPVWLWSADATRILWGNATAAAIFNASSSTALTTHTIDPKGSAALQIVRLAGTLGHGATPRLERLRGFGGRVGGALMCSCSRISLADRTPGILVVATEAVGRLSPEAKAQRLLADCEEPLVLFTADGVLLAATASARSQLGGADSLEALGAATLGAAALAAGRAHGEPGGRKLSIQRIGADPWTALLASFASATGKVMPAHSTAPPSITPAGNAVATRAGAPAQPLRFVWQIDDGGRFTLDSEEFRALIGPQTSAALGQPWSAIATILALDPDSHVARAIASRETWSGITVAFPMDGTDARLAVELSGLPVFDRDRNFLGYRGFGVCRRTAGVAELKRTERPQPAAVEPPVFRDEQPPPRPTVNVVRLRPPVAADDTPVPTPVERSAFSEQATRLSMRLRDRDKNKSERPDDTAAPSSPREIASTGLPPPVAQQPAVERTVAREPARPEPPTRTFADQRPILDRLPVGMLVYRLDKLIYANRSFLEWTGYKQLYDLEAAGGLDALFVEPTDDGSGENNGGQSLTIATNQGGQVPVAARLFSAPWDGESALVLMLTGVGSATGDVRPVASETSFNEARALREASEELAEVRAILDATADGVILLDRQHRVQSANGGAVKLFGYDSGEVTGLPFTVLFAQQSQDEVLRCLGRAGAPGGTGPATGRDVIGRNRDGGLLPLSMTLSRIKDDTLCAVFRDVSDHKKAMSEPVDTKRRSEKASSTQADFLAKISHEIRTPLNAIIGFSEVMMQERFGPIGNERYVQYLEDIHTSGGHLIALLNDLLDLSKIEAGKLDLHFTSIDLNELTQQSVDLMQPQANRERIIIRTSLGSTLPTVTADARSVRQILLNLISNSIKFTGVGGQVIVSTARGDDREVVLRVRHTGIGMSDQDVAAVLEPFRQIASSVHWGSGGTGLGLPLTKALAEANRASFRIKSAIDAGTLVEVAFPSGRIAAE